MKPYKVKLIVDGVVKYDQHMGEHLLQLSAAGAARAFKHSIIEITQLTAPQ